MIEMSDSRVRDIPILESSERLIDVREVSSLKYGSAPESSETEPYYRFLRAGVIQRLLAAQDNLPEGLFFKIYEGYRHPVFQQKLFNEQWERTISAHFEWDKARCFKEASKLVSPVETLDGEKIVSPHSTGGALDVEVVNANGEVIDFGMEIKDWFSVKPELCESHYSGLCQKAKENREMMIELLEAVGFVNYPREWWHFSYGDQYWAFCNKETHAIYDQVYL